MADPTASALVPAALGQVTAIDGQYVTVLFLDIPANPPPVRDSSLRLQRFKMDVAARNELVPGQWVVGSWSARARREPASNALLIQGSMPGGTHLRSLERAVTEPAIAGWLKRARADMVKSQAPKPAGDVSVTSVGGGGAPDTVPPVDPAVAILDPVLADPPAGDPGPWLPTPVPMPQATEELGFPDGYVRIGYVAFTLDSPTEEISIEEMMPPEASQTLRSRTPVYGKNWYAQQKVKLAFTLIGPEAINGILLPLWRLFRKAPFLPVVNQLLFDHGITALALQEMQVATQPGYPNVLKVELLCWSFNWQSFFPTATSFDQLICYPLLKLWAEKPLDGEPRCEPLPGAWNGRFRMRLPDEQWLERTNEFPTAARVWAQQNADLQAATQAKAWRDSGTPARMEGFKPVEDHTGLVDQMGFNSYKVYELDGDVGRAPLRKGPIAIVHADYVFIRARTVHAATILANDPGCALILDSSFQISHGEPDGDATFEGGHTEVSPETFVQDLYRLTDPHEASQGGDEHRIRKNLPEGLYVFVMQQESMAFDHILQAIARTPAPEAPSEPDPNPQADGTFDPPGLVIEQITASAQNTIAPLSVRSQRTATHQYLGSNATFYTVTGTLPGFADGLPGSPIPELTDFMEEISRLGRKYRGKLDGTPFGGFIILENELFQMLGTKYALPLYWKVDTIPQFPGSYRFTLSLVEFDQTQRRREVIKDMMGDLPETSPQFTTSSLHDGFPKRYFRNRDLHRRLRAVELYPDLKLPTHAELAQWVEDIKNGEVWDFDAGGPTAHYWYLAPAEGGTGWNWTTDPTRLQDGFIGTVPNRFLTTDGPDSRIPRFADPDFYCAPSQRWGADFVEGILKNAKVDTLEYTDGYGLKGRGTPGVTRLDHTQVSDPDGHINFALTQVNQGHYPKPLGASANAVDDAIYGKIVMPTGHPSEVPVGQGEGNTAQYFIPPPATPPKVGTISNVDSQSIQNRIHTYGPAVAAAAKQFNLPQDLLFGLVEQESTWRVGATSNKGATGLGQLMPDTATGLGVKNRSDAVEGAYGAARLLRQLLNQFGGNEQLALAAYNSTPSAVKKYGGIPPFKETRHYVTLVMQKRQKYAAGHLEAQAAQEIDRPQIANQTKQWRDLFNQGYVISKGALLPYVIDPESEAPAKDQFIPTYWLKPIADYYGDETVAWDADPNKAYQQAWYFVITPQNMPSFFRTAKNHAVLEKIVPEKSNFRLPGKYEYELAGGGYNPPSLFQTFHDDTGQGRDIFHDMRKSWMTGRLVTAFPSFYVAIVDGGRSLRVWRLFDHIYGMAAVTRIAVHRTRKGPVETAVVGFSNMYGHLTAAGADTRRVQEGDTRGIWTLDALRHGVEGFFRFDSETVARWNEHLDALMLRPGARLHIRMGYTADAAQMPVVFNGVISEVPSDGGVVEVVALSDGLELTNDMAPNGLQGSVPVTRLNSSMGEGINPRELVMSFMAPTNALDGLSNALGEHVHEFFYEQFRNPYGIEHFGQVLRAGLLQDDAEVGVNIYNPESSVPYNHSSSWDSHMRILQAWRWEGTKTLIGINMANATPWAIFETTRKTIPDYVLYSLPFEFRSTLFMGRPWFPVFTQYREDAAGEFLARDEKGQPLTDGRANRESFFDWKPFSQFHLITSDVNLLANEVRADSSNVITQCQAVGTYNGWWPGQGDLSNEASFLMQLDSDIYDEQQRLKVVESGLYSTVNMKLTEANSDPGGKARVAISLGETALAGSGAGAAIGAAVGALGGPVTVAVGAMIGTLIGGTGALVAGIVGLMAGPLRSFLFSRRVEDHVAAMTLKDHVKDMYQGSLGILGDPWVKPFDLVGIADHQSGLNGLAEVKAVTHTMSLESGFVSAVEPDCLANYYDYEGRDIYVWLMAANNHFWSATALASFFGYLNRKMSEGAALRGARMAVRWVDRVTRNAERLGEKDVVELGMSAAEARAVLAALRSHVNLIQQALRRGASPEVATGFQAFIQDQGLNAVFVKLPKAIQLEIHIQRILRAVPGTAGYRQFLKNVQAADKAGDKLFQGLEATATRRASQEAADWVAADARVQAEAAKLGKTAADLDVVRDATKAGKVAAGEETLAAALKEADKLQAKALRTAYVSKVLGNVPGAKVVAKEWLTGLVHSTTLKLAAIPVLEVAIGGLCDWVTRWAIARQCLTLFPLRLYDREYTAGINGHRGAVVGDRIGGLDAFIEGGAKLVGEHQWIAFIPLIGDLLSAGVAYTPPTLPQSIPNERDGD